MPRVETANFIAEETALGGRPDPGGPGRAARRSPGLRQPSGAWRLHSWKYLVGFAKVVETSAVTLLRQTGLLNETAVGCEDRRIDRPGAGLEGPFRPGEGQSRNGDRAAGVCAVSVGKRIEPRPSGCVSRWAGKLASSYYHRGKIHSREGPDEQEGRPDRSRAPCSCVFQKAFPSPTRGGRLTRRESGPNARHWKGQCVRGRNIRTSVGLLGIVWLTGQWLWKRFWRWQPLLVRQNARLPI